MSQKPIQLGSSNEAYKCSAMSPGNHLFWGQRVKGKGHESEKNIAGVRLLHPRECWLFLVSRVSWRADLGDAVGIMFVLQQQRQRVDVIVLGGDVQRRKLEPGTSVRLEQHRRHLVVILLNGDWQCRETALYTNCRSRYQEIRPLLYIMNKNWSSV